MRPIRHIMIWLAMVGLLVPGASGAVLCIEADGQLSIERPHSSVECAPMCTAPAEDGAGGAVPEECVDLALVDRVSHTSRTDLPPQFAAPVVLWTISWTDSPRSSVCGRVETPPQGDAAQSVLRTTILRI